MQRNKRGNDYEHINYTKYYFYIGGFRLGMEADAAQRKSEALFSIAKTFSQISSSYGGLRIDIR